MFGIFKLGHSCAKLSWFSYNILHAKVTLHCVTLICQLLDCNETPWGGCVTVWGFLIIAPPILHCLTMSERTSEVSY